jgi:hypothetical protein
MEEVLIGSLTAVGLMALALPQVTDQPALEVDVDGQSWMCPGPPGVDVGEDREDEQTGHAVVGESFDPHPAPQEGRLASCVLIVIGRGVHHVRTGT